MKLRANLLAKALVPALALVGIVWVFVAHGDEITAPIRKNVERLPRPESISFERIVFKPQQVVAHVRNTGPESIAIADVHLNDMATQAFITPSKTIPKLGKAIVTIPFDWDEGDPYEIRIVSSTGLTHSAQVDVAAMTPTPTWRFFGVFALLGVYVGVLPVFLGIAWLPVLRRLSAKATQFFLAFTVGLLVFLGVDALQEAFELREKVAGPFKPEILIFAAVFGTFLAISALADWLSKRSSVEGQAVPGLGLAYLVALGIGAHNLGEGLAIGSAYSSGQVALGGLLVIGFAIHNTTEGVAIVAPISRSASRLRHLVALGLIGGFPTILGTWAGGLAYDPIWSLVFLGVGAGAVLQVVHVIAKSLGERPFAALTQGVSVAGLITGMAVMYMTGLMIA